MRARCALTVVLLTAGLLTGCVERHPDDGVLFDFESETELDRINWQCFVVFSISDRFATRGSSSLKVELYPSAFPGFNPKLPVTDWRSFKSLEFDIMNPEESDFHLSLKIDDLPGPPAAHERFARALTVVPGVNHVTVELEALATGSGRKLDLGRIEKLFLVSENLPAQRTFYIDRLVLSR